MYLFDLVLTGYFGISLEFLPFLGIKRFELHRTNLDGFVFNL